VSRRRRDAEAFALIYERHHQALYRYCRTILHDDEDARDALQSTMLRSFAALKDEERHIELRPWLFRIAHNEAVTILRQRRGRRALDPTAEPKTYTLERSLEDRTRLAELRADLADLPDQQRAALVLRELSGLSHAEIAVVIESTARNVKQTLFEARVALLEFRAGREMACEPVRRAISDGDGRVLRGRRIRGHLRACPGCQAFRADLMRRPADLAALVPPLPAAAALAVLARVLPGGAAAGASSATSGGLLAGVAGKATAVAVVATTVAGGVAVAPRASHALRPDDVRAAADGGPRASAAQQQRGGRRRDAMPTAMVLGAPATPATASARSVIATPVSSAASGSPGQQAAAPGGDPGRPDGKPPTPAAGNNGNLATPADHAAKPANTAAGRKGKPATPARVGKPARRTGGIKSKPATPAGAAKPTTPAAGRTGKPTAPKGSGAPPAAAAALRPRPPPHQHPPPPPLRPRPNPPPPRTPPRPVIGPPRQKDPDLGIAPAF
jgi:RNA polymerase sigma factor (sigma-70 family)